MKLLFLFIAFFSLITFSWSQTTGSKVTFKYLEELDPYEPCYTFKAKASDYKVAGKSSGVIIIKICKGDDASQLSALGPKQIWLGKNYRNVEYSEIVITFSQPVYSVNFVMSHFNNDDLSGNEQVDEFHIFEENKSELTNCSFNWSTGASAYQFSNEDWTTFDPIKKVIAALPGAFGEQASGRLSISNTTPFTKITFRQTVIRATPNGILIDDEINFSTTIDSTLQKNNIDTIKAIKQPIAIPILADTNRLNKKETPLLSEIKNDTIILHKAIPLEKKVGLLNKPAEHTIIKNPAKKSITPVKKATSKAPAKTTAEQTNVKKTTQTKNITTSKIPSVKTTVQTTVKKIIQTKPPIKKTPAVKQPSIKPIDSLLTFKLSEIKNLKVGEKIKLEKVFFKQSLPELLPESFPELDTLVLVLKQYTHMEIAIQGHTDNQGMAVLNQQLSEQRAEAVKQYLTSKGIEAIRLTYKGYGSSRPFIDNETEEHRRKNRRVEFMITKR